MSPSLKQAQVQARDEVELTGGEGLDHFEVEFCCLSLCSLPRFEERDIGHSTRFHKCFDGDLRGLSRC